ncbi:hypothetical protein SNE40_021369 [Patella caerulea]|uniref:Uncharacterized protein n=1 Tax=Patella caerulea TaxID=87958 RepID=A0AAN8GGN8_PATCE
MAGVKIISLVLCSLGVFMSLRPHWLYIDQFIQTYYQNITDDELYDTIYPVKDYSGLILLIIVILVTDYVKYKPIIVLQGFFSVILMSLFNWDQQIIPLIVSQVFHGFVMATNIAFYAYIFAVADSEKYKLSTCLSQISVLFGIFLGNLLAVLFLSLNITGLGTINLISFAFSVVTLIVALMLPHVKPRIPTTREIIERELQLPSGLSIPETVTKSPWEVDRRPSMHSTGTQGIMDTYTHINDPAFTAYARSNMYSDIDTSSLGFYGDYSINEQYTSSIDSESNENSREDNSNTTEVPSSQPDTTQKDKINKFLKDLKKAYSKKLVIYWSSWLIFSICGHLMLEDNFRRLLNEIVPGRNSPLVYDASVSTLAALLGIIPVIIYGVIKGTWTVYSEPILAILGLFTCLLYCLLANINNIWAIYSLYIIYYLLFQLMFVVALYQIGDVLQSRRYGFIFGMNLFIAVFLKVILQSIQGYRQTLHLPITTQITVMGGIFGLYGLSFLTKMLYSLIDLYRQSGGCCGNYSNPQDRDLLVASTS